MKYIIAILVGFIFITSCNASSLDLFVQNSTSNSTIIVEKPDGMKFTIEPNSKIENITFEKNSQVKNYIDGRLVCTWIVTHKGIPSDWTLTGLEYDYEGGPICGRIATKIIDRSSLSDKNIAMRF